MMLRPRISQVADIATKEATKIAVRNAGGANDAVSDYFYGEIERSKKRVLELAAFSKQNAGTELGRDYLKQAAAERRRNAKWAFWHALQFPDETNRSAACVVAVKLLEEAYPSKSAIGFAMRHPFISERISALRGEFDSCMKNLKRT